MLDLYGYRYSVYTRIARLVLVEADAAYRHIEIDPFTDNSANPHPWRRVPTLIHDGFALYETAAIARYVDDVFNGGRLQPADPKARARMQQIVGIVDAYAYWPLVRQVFAQRVFGPLEGFTPNEDEIAQGLDAAGPVLSVLEEIASDGLQLSGNEPSLADLHLVPMIDYFNTAPEGHAALSRFPHLSAWWDTLRQRPSVIETDPDIAGYERATD